MCVVATPGKISTGALAQGFQLWARGVLEHRVTKQCPFQNVTHVVTLPTSRGSVASQTTPFKAAARGRDLCKTVERGDSRRRLGVQEEPRDQKERLRVPSGRDLGHDRQKVTRFHRVTVDMTTPLSVHEPVSFRG